MRPFQIISLSFLFAAGCSTALTQQGQSVRIIKEEPQNCQELGDVSGSGSAYLTVADNLQNARNDMRNSAAEMGANTVVLDTNNGRGAKVILGGRAFKCLSK